MNTSHSFGDYSTTINGQQITIHFQHYAQAQPEVDAFFEVVSLDRIPRREQRALLREAERFQQALARPRGLTPKEYLDVAQACTDALHALQTVEGEHMTAWLQRVALQHQPTTVVFQSDSNLLLNLPWQLARVLLGTQTWQLEELSHLTIAKALADHFDATRPLAKTAGPLRVLVMVSSPEDSTLENRLSYEDEERAILEAFDPLIGRKQVEITFTEDGSLETLRHHLRQQPFHILLYSGHGRYDKATQTGYLELEDPLTLNQEPASAEAFAEVLTHSPNHRVPLVILSACQTAQGAMPHTQEPFKGISNLLLQQGIPAVIAMAHSIADYAAAEYAAGLFTYLAHPQDPHSISAAHQAALRILRDKERHFIAHEQGKPQASPFYDPARADTYRSTAPAMDIPVVTVPADGPLPSQYLMPQLYLTRPVRRLVSLERDYGPRQGRTRHYLQERPENYRFIGRRKEKAQILRPFLEEGKPVMLLGMGGVGKSALAEHVIERYQVRYPDAIYFIVKPDGGGLAKLVKDMELYLTETLHHYGHIATLAQLEKRNPVVELISVENNNTTEAFTIFYFLLSELQKHGRPVFIFDNLESFQKTEEGHAIPQPKASFSSQHASLEKLIRELITYRRASLLLTGRFPLPDIEGLHVLSMTTVGITDFWKKCMTLKVAELRWYLSAVDKERLSQAVYQKVGFLFSDLVQTLHTLFGGHYRSLEFFDQSYADDPNLLLPAFEGTIPLLENLQQVQQENALERATELAFTELLKRCNTLEKELLQVLSHFRVSVPMHALALQMPAYATDALQSAFYRLEAFTLIEVYESVLGEVEFWMPPLTKSLWELPSTKETKATFNHDKAGAYFEDSIHRNLAQSGQDERTTGRLLLETQEAFYHYLFTDRIASILKMAEPLVAWYSNQIQHEEAIHFFVQTIEKVGFEQCTPLLLRTMGVTYMLYGHHEKALTCLEAFQQKGELNTPEGSIALTYLAMVAERRGRIDEAITSLQQALQIQRREEELKSWEAISLGLLGKINLMQGDYAEAHWNYKEVLYIAKEQHDERLEASATSSLANIAFAEGSLEEAIQGYERVLQIRKSHPDVLSEAMTLVGVSRIYSAKKQSDKVLSLLYRALSLQRKVHEQHGEAQTLFLIGKEYFQLNQAEKAQPFLEQALQIQQQIEDVAGCADTLIQLAKLQIGQGKLDVAMPRVSEAMRTQFELGNYEGLTAAFIAWGDIAEKVYFPQGAYIFYRNALVVENERGAKQNLPDLLIKISQLAGQVGDTKNQIRYLEECCQLQNQPYREAVLNMLIPLYQAQKEWGRVEEIAQQLLEIAQSENNLIREGTALTTLAGVARAEGQYDRAYSLSERVLATFQEVGDASYEALGMFNHSVIHRDVGRLDDAYELAKDAWDLYMLASKRDRLTDLLWHLHGVAHELTLVEEAIDWLEKALTYVKQSQDELNQASVYLRLGKYLMQQKQYARALEYLLPAHQIFENDQALDVLPGAAECLFGISDCYQNLGDFEQAQTYDGKGKEVKGLLRKVEADIGFHLMTPMIDLEIDHPLFPQFLMASWEIVHGIRDEEGMVDLLHIISIAKLKVGNKSDYLVHSHDAYQRAQALDIFHKVHTIGSMLGFLLCASGQADQGLPILKLALDVANNQEKENRDYLADAFVRFGGSLEAPKKE